MKYLALSARSEKNVRKTLRQGLSQRRSGICNSKSQKYNYINDEEYVRTYLMFNANRYGAKKIAYKLVNEKGVDKKLVDNVLLDVKDDEKNMSLR